MTDPQWIDGVVLTALQQISNDLGAVLHMLRCDAPEFIGFGECYFSEVLPGAVKAWKRHRVQTQQLAVPVGHIRVVMFDDRLGSRSRGRLQVLELGRPNAYGRLRIPPGVWYGFACLDQTAALLANCPDLPHDPAESESLPSHDTAIPYDWMTAAGRTAP